MYILNQLKSMWNCTPVEFSSNIFYFDYYSPFWNW